VSRKKGATDFFAVTFTNIDGFLQFFVHNFTRECQSHWRKKFLPYICYVATIPCKSLRHKSNTFHTILAFCTCLYRSHLGQPVSTKQAKHCRKSEARNLCSKCLPFTRTHAFKRLCHCAIAAAMTVCMVQQPPLPQQSLFKLSTFFQLNHGSTSGRPPLEAYRKCCRPPDSNLAN